METINLELSKTELLEALKNIKAVLPKNKEKQMLYNIELHIHPEILDISAIGAIFSVSCKSNTDMKVFLPFLYLWTAANDKSSDEFIIQINEGKFEFGMTKFQNDKIKCILPQEQRDIELSINTSVRELLALKYKYKPEELELKGLSKMIEKTDDEMREAVMEAFLNLSKYGVKEKDLFELVEKRIKEHKLD